LRWPLLRDADPADLGPDVAFRRALRALLADHGFETLDQFALVVLVAVRGRGCVPQLPPCGLHGLTATGFLLGSGKSHTAQGQCENQRAKSLYGHLNGDMLQLLTLWARHSQGADEPNLTGARLSWIASCSPMIPVGWRSFAWR
jgi:hypothetical protein